MSEVDKVRWMVTFFHTGGRSKDEPSFPEVELWHPNKKASMEAGARVLRELKEKGDQRDWIAVGHPDPFKVGNGEHPGGQWMLPPPPPKIFDPDKVPPIDLPDEGWDEFNRALSDGRRRSEL